MHHRSRIVALIGFVLFLVGCGAPPNGNGITLDPSCEECPSAKADKAAASGPDDLPNPLFDSWNACPVGTFTIHETRRANSSPTRTRRQLVDKSARELTVEVRALSFEGQPSQQETIQRVVVPRFQKRDQAANLSPLPDPDQTILLEGKSFRVGRRTHRIVDGNGDHEETHFESEGVPGLLVRTELRPAGAPLSAPVCVTELVTLELPLIR